MRPTNDSGAAKLLLHKPCSTLDGVVRGAHGGEANKIRSEGKDRLQLFLDRHSRAQAHIDDLHLMAVLFENRCNVTQPKRWVAIDQLVPLGTNERNLHAMGLLSREKHWP